MLPKMQSKLNGISMEGIELKCNYAVVHALVQSAIVLLTERKDNYFCFMFLVQIENRIV